MAKGIIDSAMVFDPVQVSFDALAIDDFIESHGIAFNHFKAVPCPGSDTENGSLRSTHEEHSCVNSFHYIYAGTFRGVLSNNPLNKAVLPEGIFDQSKAYVILPRFYTDTQETMHFTCFDRIEMCKCDDPSVWVPYWEKLTDNQTGICRTRFPIQKIEYVINTYGEQYSGGIDFINYNGSLKWISQNRPGFDLMTQLGVPFSTRYLYKPNWYVSQLVHQIRLLNTATPEGDKSQIRFPYMLQVLREIDYLSQAVRDDADPPNELMSVGTGGGNFTSPK